MTSIPADYSLCTNGPQPTSISFTCPDGQACVWLAANTTVLCCPQGITCDTIEPITCNMDTMNATAFPGSLVKTLIFNASLPSCGGATCCPFGYSCNDEQTCDKSLDQSHLPEADALAASSAVSTSISSPVSSSISSPISSSTLSSGEFPTTTIQPSERPSAGSRSQISGRRFQPRIFDPSQPNNNVPVLSHSTLFSRFRSGDGQMAASPLYRAILRRHVQQLLRPRQRTGQHRTKSSKTHAPEKEDPVPVPNTVAALPLWQRLGPLTRLAQAYARAQRRRPYVTQLCTSLVIYFCADLSAQRISGKDYDPVRTVRSLVIGGISSIPSYRWFLFLSHNFNYSSHLVSLATKVVVNQLCFTPIFNSYFFGMQAFLVGDTLPEVWERIRRTVPVSFVNSMKLWPAVTAFSFTFVPIEYRSVFAGVIAVGWQTYLSYLNRQAEEEEESRKLGGQERVIEKKKMVPA